MLGTNQVDLAYTLDQPLLQPNLVLAADVPEPVCFIAPSGLSLIHIFGACLPQTLL